MKNLNPVTKLLLGVLVVAIVLTATRPVAMALQTVLILSAVLFFARGYNDFKSERSVEGKKAV